ncbi:MAG: hypothetical protein DPW09_07020 [Anaerolineae bacterium]|nr:hypothetical protein [Anaerolineae bacterium]
MQAKSKVIPLLLGVILLLLVSVYATSAAGGLTTVGPINPDNGFPLWYKDANGLALELCVDFANPLCNFAPLPGDPFDPNQPPIVPTNFPDEAFWWSADALLETNGSGGGAGLVLALEAAFANGPVVPGDQVSFGRIRYRVDLDVGGTYTVTHPYGQDVHPGVAAGVKAINFTEDIGIGAPGDFTGALNSRIGPFLTWDTFPGDPDLAPGFIGDPIVEHRVTGSPFNTNFFRIEGPDNAFTGSPFLCANPFLGASPTSTTDCIETDLFLISGKIRTNTGTGASLATYKNSTGPGPESLNVYAFTEAGAILRVTGAGLAPTDMEGDGNGRYFARLGFDGSSSPPATITVTNLGDNPPSVSTVTVVDVVTINRAEYNADTNTLEVVARSSDEDSVPTLTIRGDGGVVLGTAAPGDTFSNVMTVPPVKVVVGSSRGGLAEEPVTVVGSDFNPANLNPSVNIIEPLDGLSVVEGTSVTFTGTATDPEDGNLDASLIWTSSLDNEIGTGATFSTVLSVGVHTIVASVSDSGGLGSSDSVVVTVVAAGGNTPPTTANDNAATTGVIPVTINVLANDNDPDGLVDPTTVVVGPTQNGGTVSVNPSTGAILFTPNTNSGTSPVAVGPVHPTHGFPVWYQDSTPLQPTDSFTYTVRDNAGAISNEGTVTVNQNPLVLELCLNSQARCGLPTAPPFTFPDNFPNEVFYWSADAITPTGGGDALLTLALEGGFANGAPAAGDQITFARLRLRVDGLVPGAVYTITHPYGVEVLPADGTGGINITNDLGTDGGFNGVFNQMAGPFLVWDQTAPAPPAGYIGDGATPHTVTGSPFGTNFFRIEGPDAGGAGNNVTQTDQFAVVGKLVTAATGPGNTAPSVTIDTPSDGANFASGTSIAFSGTVNDAEEAGLSANLVWTSDVDGPLGNGAAISAVLSDGTHQITAAVVDSGGLTGQASITVNVTANAAPTVSITSPADGTLALVGDTVNFAGTATDGPDDVSASLIWSSNIDGQIGAGASFSRNDLSLGAHTITASVTDPGGLTGVATITLNITTPTGNTPPSVAITAPTDGTAVTVGDSISFEATATDTDGPSPVGAIEWSSDIDGPLGTGSPLVVNGLSLGTHTITASASDGADTGSASITVVVNSPTNNVPTVSITTPVDGAAFAFGASIDFAATAADVEDGDVSANLVWTSDVAGQIGTGASFAAVLSPGTHTITASATDNNGDTGSASLTITVAAADTVSITKAEFASGNNRWRIDGTGSVPGNTITISQVDPGTGNVLQVIGTAQVAAAGTWRLQTTTGPAPIGQNPSLRAVSSGGGVSNLFVARVK